MTGCVLAAGLKEHDLDIWVLGNRAAIAGAGGFSADDHVPLALTLREPLVSVQQQRAGVHVHITAARMLHDAQA